MFDAIKKHFDTIHRLSDEEWQYFKKYLSAKHLAKGDFLLRAGQIEQHLSFIAKGGIRLFYVKAGKEYCIDFRFENEFVSSYSSFLLQTPSRMYLQALEETTLIAMRHEVLQQLYKHSKNGERLGRMNAEQLFIQKELREASLMLDSPDDRYLLLMEHKSEWFQRVPQYHLASYLNVSPETLSRIKKRNMK